MDQSKFDELIGSIKSQLTCADVLQQHGIEWDGHGVSCPMPGHEDKDPSFGLFDNARGFKCHVCDRKGDVIELETALNGGDRGQAIRTLTECIGNGSQPDSKPAKKKRKGGKVHKTADAAARASAWGMKQEKGYEWSEIRRDFYHDASGEIVAAVLRFHRADGATKSDGKPEKDYRPIHVVSGGWKVGDPPGLWPLFNLPAIMQSDGPVFINEGEPASCAGAEIGLVATTSSHGSGSPEKSDWTVMSGRDVVVLPDFDESGGKYVEKVTGLIHAAGARSIKILSLPDLPAKGDLVEFVSSRSGKSHEEIRSEIEQLIESAEVWTPPEGTATSSEPDPTPLDTILALPKGTPVKQITEALRDAVPWMNEVDELTRSSAFEELKPKLRELGIEAPTTMLKAAFESKDDNDEGDTGQSITIVDPKPWSEAVDGSELLQEIKDTIERYVVLPEESAIAAALWILHAHAHDAAFISPFLAILSPVKRCGKTTMITVVGRLSPRRMPTSNISPAALFRSVEKWQPTLMIGEADTFMRHNENHELRGILNSGHSKTNAYVVRCVEPSFEPTTFRTWCPKIIGMIGALPDTLEDRSIICHLHRRNPGDTVERLREDRLDVLDPICRKAWRWATDNSDNLRIHEPQVPSELHDRAADNWRPLLAIAETVGGSWVDKSKLAAVVLSCKESGDTESIRELLLSDIRDLFESQNIDRLFSEDIVNALKDMDGRPWPDFSRGKEITKAKIARLLKPFKISPKEIRVGADHAKGYLLEDFKDAFNRYIPPDPPPSDRDTATTPVNIDQNAISDRDTESEMSRSESAKTPVNIELSRCRGLKGGVSGGIPVSDPNSGDLTLDLNPCGEPQAPETPPDAPVANDEDEWRI